MTARVRPLVLDRNDRVIATCCACGTTVADDEGALWVDLAEVNRYERAVALWRAEHPGAVTVGELLDHPDEPCWRVSHYRCSLEDVSSYYWISVERVRTLRQLIAWTSHLLGKSWLTSTDWDAVLHDLAGDIAA